MEPRHTRTSRSLRLSALTLAAAALVTVAYLDFRPGAGVMPLPRHAHPGELVLKPCRYETNGGDYRADCGTLVVPEDRADPASRLIALPLIRIRARSPHPGGAVFRLNHGPGQTNMRFPQVSRLVASHDVVLVGYRGVDGSSVLSCPEVSAALRSAPDLLQSGALHAYSNAFRRCVARLRGAGVDLAGYTMPEQAADLEAARIALGYTQIDLLSESAGTRLAMIYAWRYPHRVARSVMIGVNPPGNFLYNGATIDQQLAHYSTLCAKDASCRSRTPNLAATIASTAAHTPRDWLSLPIGAGNVRIGTFLGLANATSAAAPLAAPSALNMWVQAAHGDPSGLWLMSLMARLVLPESYVWGEAAAIGMADAQAAERYFASSSRRGTIIDNPATQFLWGGGGLLAAWPRNPGSNEYTRPQRSSVPTLLIGGTVDFATPPQNATTELLPYLSHGHQVVLAELGHTADFWDYEPRAGNRLINTFLDTGAVDTSAYSYRRMSFVDSPSLATIAKVVLAVMFGLAALALLSLAWMAYRVHRHGAVGRRAGRLVRVALTPLLGLGGWAAAALAAMALWPSLPLSDEAMAIVSIGVPLAIGTHLAWVHRDWPAALRLRGAAAVLLGAGVGAWLGYGAASGILAPLTTVLGGAALANLLVILVDIVDERSARGRPTGGPGRSLGGES